MFTQSHQVAAAYQEYQREDIVRQRIETHLIMVKRIAYHLKAKLPDQVMVDDLIQSGMVGLIEAAKKFDENQGASFETYAGIRIRGAMLDEIRKNDWTPRSVHRNTRMLTEVIAKLENTNGRHSSDAEIANELGISLEEYHAMMMDSNNHRVLSFEEFSLNNESLVDNMPHYQPLLLDGLQKQDLKDNIAKAIEQLPKRERLVMSLYYFEELNLREIGAILGVSESRISQIHSLALNHVQDKMKKIIDETKPE